ncbi:4-hydroxy-3-methylbut-2-enyl diphosphate reductase [Amycolatopsis rhizosphaerae]|uniref:4-hydroxy-3-methylbut-2-enyl diphosphate reductase n=1 Tax=Amycolatopsis rhizosphaerae TaxID=2053003 RepID=UPI001643910A
MARRDTGRIPASDAFFLHVETPWAPQHVGGLIMLDTSGQDGPPTRGQLRAKIVAALPGLPGFRRRLAPPTRWRPLRWTAHTGIDWAWHVPEFDLRRPDGRPGGMPALHRLVAELAGQPLPRDRPLWRLCVVTGIEEHVAAVISLVHHSVADGIGTINLMLSMFDSPDLTSAMGDVARPGRLRQVLGGAVGLAQLAFDRRPQGRLTVSGTAKRTFGTLTLDLHEVRELARRRGVRVTDLLLAGTAGALRRLGLTVHTGPIASSDTLVEGADRARLAVGGALAVDMESAQFAEVPGPLAVVRAIVDTPDRPLWRPGTVLRGIAGLRSLHAAAPVLREWCEATGEGEVLLASPRSFCAGVDRAIEIVERALQRYGAPVYVRRQIVHNAHVVRRLEGLGAVFVQEIEDVPPGATTVLAAHGVAPSVRQAAAAKDLRVIDATCPLVTKVHNEVRRYSARGDTVFLIGHADHEEVEGTVGEAPGQVVVVEDAAAAAHVQPRDPGKVAYAMQTTLAVDEAEEIATVLRERFPAMQAPRRDDICYATTNRQRAVRAVAGEADLVLVVGSANSSNSKRLVEVARRQGAPAHLVDDVSEVDLRWLAGARRIGITAGASAPPHLVEELTRCLSGLGRTCVRDSQVADEDIRFTLPREVG